MITACRAWSIRRRGTRMLGKNEAPERALGIRKRDVPGLGGDHLSAGTVALTSARFGAFIPGRAEVLGRLGFDQLLQHQAHGLLDQVQAIGGAKRLQQLGHGRL